MRHKSGNYEALDLESQVETSKCFAELNDVFLELGLLLPGSRELDQKEIRKLLNKKIDSEQWSCVLKQLLKKDSYFMTDGRFQQEADKKDLMKFLESMLWACVEDDLQEHLKTMIDWLKELSEKVSHLDTILKPPQDDEEGKEKEEKCFYKNNVAMRRACKKRNIAIVFVLFKGGFHLQTRLEKEDVLKLSDIDQLMAEISILKARASPAYLLAETKQNFQDPMYFQDPFTFQDPISKAMELIKICQTLEETRRGAIKKVGKIREDLEKFVVKMLDLCHPSTTEDKCEVGLFLSQG